MATKPTSKKTTAAKAPAKKAAGPVKTVAKAAKTTKAAKATKVAARKPVAAKKSAPAKTAVKTPSAAAKATRSRALDIAGKSLRKPPAPGVEELRFSIESAFERRTMLTMDEVEGSTRPLVERVIDGLESGEFRVAEPDGHGGWKVNEWLKKAVLLYFRVNDMTVTDASPAPYWDKVEARFAGYGAEKFREAGVRVVPARSPAAGPTSARTWC
jgi:Tetrahydrodipicolinate N-succinyltransferase